jgi:integrase
LGGAPSGFASARASPVKLPMVINRPCRHDLHHSFATTNLSAGEHYMQASKWLGHSTFVLTLSTYADYINEDEQAAPKVGRGVADNVTALHRRKAN